MFSFLENIDWNLLKCLEIKGYIYNGYHLLSNGLEDKIKKYIYTHICRSMERGEEWEGERENDKAKVNVNNGWICAKGIHEFFILLLHFM